MVVVSTTVPKQDVFSYLTCPHLGQTNTFTNPIAIMPPSNPSNFSILDLQCHRKRDFPTGRSGSREGFPHSFPFSNSRISFIFSTSFLNRNIAYLEKFVKSRKKSGAPVAETLKEKTSCSMTTGKSLFYLIIPRGSFYSLDFITSSIIPYSLASSAER